MLGNQRKEPQKIEALQIIYLRRASRVSRLERVKNDVIRERKNRKETVIEDINVNSFPGMDT